MKSEHKRPISVELNAEPSAALRLARVCPLCGRELDEVVRSQVVALVLMLGWPNPGEFVSASKGWFEEVVRSCVS
jgi:hypothetical protein